MADVETHPLGIAVYRDTVSGWHLPALAIPGPTTNELAVIGPGGEARSAGIVELVVDYWREVTGDPEGLIPGADYFLSTDQPGRLTRNQPSQPGQVLVRVGTADTNTRLVLGIGHALTLG